MNRPWINWKLRGVLSRPLPARRPRKQMSLWLRTELVEIIDRYLAKEGGDRSKFIRDAVREKLLREKEPAR